MTSESNQTTFDVKVYFVIPSKYKSCNECDENMWDAYNVCIILIQNTLEVSLNLNLFQTIKL
jgi:hypothetical protein